MSAVIAIAGALGIALFVTGLPPFRGTTLAERVEPYLGGLHGKPSGLLSPRERTRLARLVTALERVERLLPSSRAQLEHRLRGAQRIDASAFRLEQLAWGTGAMASTLCLVLLAVTAGVALDPVVVPVLGGLSFLSGWMARDWWLGRQLLRRREWVQDELPIAIDLTTLAIVSGESIPAAFARVATLLGPGIGAEFRQVVADMRAGAPTIEALEGMKRRAAANGIMRLVDALVTGIERGTPLAEVLAAQAEDAREARRRELIESGGRREVMMLVPVVFLIMPVVVLFTLLPGLVALDLLVP